MTHREIDLILVVFEKFIKEFENPISAVAPMYLCTNISFIAKSLDYKIEDRIIIEMYLQLERPNAYNNATFFKHKLYKTVGESWWHIRLPDNTSTIKESDEQRLLFIKHLIKKLKKLKKSCI